MSLFATLRRIKGKKGPVIEGEVPSKSISSSLFTSTPNLHKINIHKENQDGQFTDGHSSSSVFKRQNDDSISLGSAKSNNLNRKASLEVTSLTSTLSSPRTPRKRPSFGSPSGNIRHFVSMVSMVKRATSNRKLNFGSTMQLTSKEGRVKRSLSKSEERLHESFGYKNHEPGVISSSSSCSSDVGSISGGNGSLKRNYSSRSDRSTPEVQNEIIEEKTPEEILRSNLFLQGIKKFNIDHNKGVEFLVSKELIQNTPEEVAQFLKQGEGLSKTAIGNYLGEHIDFNEDVLRAFVELHDFSNVILVQALRQFLWSFRLPGEAQKIDRMMEAFAKRYCQLNPDIFSNTDTCYLMSYAIIMLNTTLHNPNVKDKPSVEKFIKMNRDIDGGKSLSTDFIISLYNSIQSEPFKIPPEDGNDLMLTFFNPVIEGWLWKQGGRYKSWKRRWFILNNNCLYYFKFTTDKTPRGIIPLENIVVKPSLEKHGKPFSFFLVKETVYSHVEYIKTCKTLSNGSTVPVQYTSIHLAAFDGRERERWIKSINNNNSISQFYSELTLRKRKAEEMSRHRHLDAPKKTVVRKSQISLPSTVSSVDINIVLPDEIYADPRKNPLNFFLEKNIRALTPNASIVSEDSIDEKDKDQDQGPSSCSGSLNSMTTLDISSPLTPSEHQSMKPKYNPNPTDKEANNQEQSFSKNASNTNLQLHKQLSMIDEYDSLYLVDMSVKDISENVPVPAPENESIIVPEIQLEKLESQNISSLKLNEYSSQESVPVSFMENLNLDSSSKVDVDVDEDSVMNISLVPRTSNCRLGKSRVTTKCTQTRGICTDVSTPDESQSEAEVDNVIPVPVCNSQISFNEENGESIQRSQRKLSNISAHESEV